MCSRGGMRRSQTATVAGSECVRGSEGKAAPRGPWPPTHQELGARESAAKLQNWQRTRNRTSEPLVENAAEGQVMACWARGWSPCTGDCCELAANAVLPGLGDPSVSPTVVRSPPQRSKTCKSWGHRGPAVTRTPLTPSMYHGAGSVAWGTSAGGALVGDTKGRRPGGPGPQPLTPSARTQWMLIPHHQGQPPGAVTFWPPSNLLPPWAPVPVPRPL